jgi:hypothetical protein
MEVLGDEEAYVIGKNLDQTVTLKLSPYGKVAFAKTSTHSVKATLNLTVVDGTPMTVTVHVS